MTPKGYAAYSSVAVNTMQNKEKILLMVYEGVIKYLELAQEGIRQQNPRMKGEAISKALAIITELDCALDSKVGGDLTQNLHVLYHWAMASITEANLKNDDAALAAVRKVLITISEGFEGAARHNHNPAPALHTNARPAPRPLNVAV
ncbi:flagellar export chaperone FliS [Desulfoferrobacter suflitae]|uniref:flagellar export chaperone FliS n=1 Tax=Desulfoferrobacter suflitae TaxID=2865782 RepID=UPI002164D863|nr:flagellar export chaperone FliS [Desulfoferrobacter suflitae]MCK8602387.1 flagellar export chaperone FliS [Desulfoferrobacter suflitae]